MNDQQRLENPLLIGVTTITMRKRLTRFIVLIIAFFQQACSYSALDLSYFEDDATISSINGTWTVVSFEDLVSNERAFPSSTTTWDMEITITFDDSENPHHFHGINATNSFSGDYVYVGNRSFRSLLFFTSEVNEPPWARQFRAAVVDPALTFKVSNEQLKIYYANQTKSVTLVRM